MSVSIVVCTKNSERHIRRCLDSVFKLQYPEYEVIVVDGNSTDRTLEIAREYPVRIFNGEDEGLGYARNLGWKKARAEFVIYFDSDMWTPQKDCIQRFLKYFENLEVAGVEDTLLCDPKLAKKSIINRLEGYCTTLTALSLPFERNRIATWGAMFRRSALAEVGGFDERLKLGAEDADVSMRLKKAGYRLLHAPNIISYHLKEHGSLKAQCKDFKMAGYYGRMLQERHQTTQFYPLERFLSIRRLKAAYQIFKKTNDPAFFLLPIYYIFRLTFGFLGWKSYKVKQLVH